VSAYYPAKGRLAFFCDRKLNFTFIYHNQTMKRILFTLVLFLACTIAHAQTAATTTAADFNADSAAIKQTALNYIEGFYNADQQRMAKAIDPELAKRIIFKDPAGDAVQSMGYSQLLLNTRRNKNTNILINNEPFKAVVTIYDIGINIAAVKVVTNKLKFMDYLQMGRINGEWKIVNTLWEFTSK